MVVSTDTERVRHSRRMVYEFLASSVDLGLVDRQTVRWMTEYGCDPARYGPQAGPVEDRDERLAGHHHVGDGSEAETVHQPVKVDNELYVRDYSRCILCYKCVEACGEDAQNTFAIAVAGRGFDARISTEYDTGLTDSACVFCGNCIGVCPTGALMFRSEYELRARRPLGGGSTDRHPHRLLVLRGRLQPGTARPGQPDREGDLPDRPFGDFRPPLHQGPVRLRIRPGTGGPRGHSHRRCSEKRAGGRPGRSGARRRMMTDRPRFPGTEPPSRRPSPRRVLVTAGRLPCP